MIVHQERQSMKPPIQQSQPIPIMSPTGKHPVPCVCPYCRQSIITRTEKSNGLLVWLASAGICLLGCAFGCCLIPFFIEDIKV
jgi:lipopolysaccharide-induced tumor necrosis factor-alpha factor